MRGQSRQQCMPPSNSASHGPANSQRTIHNCHGAEGRVATGLDVTLRRPPRCAVGGGSTELDGPVKKGRPRPTAPHLEGTRAPACRVAMSDALRFAVLTHSGGALVKTRHQRPCTIYQEFTLSGPTERLSRIVFRNYYCATITVMQDVGGGGEVQWEAVLERRLMQDPHYEGDAQDYHCIFVDEFAAAFQPSRLSKLRFYLSQPSPSWLKVRFSELGLFGARDPRAAPQFELQDVTFYAAAEAPAAALAPSPERSVSATAPSYATRFGFAQSGPSQGRLYRDTEPGAKGEDSDSPLPGSLHITDSGSTSEVEAQLQQALCSVRRELLHHESLAKRHAPHTTGLGSCSPLQDNVARVSVNPKAHTLPMPTGTPNRVVALKGGR